MKSATIKRFNRDYTDTSYSTKDPIYDLLNYIYKFNKKNVERPYDIFAYGFPTNNDCTNTYVNIHANDYVSLYHLFSYSPKANYLPSDLSPYWAHLVISFEPKHFTDTDYFLINTIAYIIGQEYRVAFAFHTNSDHAHGHLAISTININNPSKPLTYDLLYNKYIPLFIQIAKEYEYDLKLKF